MNKIAEFTRSLSKSMFDLKKAVEDGKQDHNDELQKMYESELDSFLSNKALSFIQRRISSTLDDVVLFDEYNLPRYSFSLRYEYAARFYEFELARELSEAEVQVLSKDFENLYRQFNDDEFVAFARIAQIGPDNDCRNFVVFVVCPKDEKRYVEKFIKRFNIQSSRYK